MLSQPDSDVAKLVDRINDDYEYWDTVKYKNLPAGTSARQLWTQVKASRIRRHTGVWLKYGITFTMTDRMQRMCHEFDMNFGGSWESSALATDEHKRLYLQSSQMEEAIYSSIMEGATTTRRIAKEMLKKKKTPKDRSQQMIVNNYQTISFIVGNKNDVLSEEALLHIHRLMTRGTLDDAADEGRFRTTDNIVVGDALTGDTVHTPPSKDDIPRFIDELCRFFNEDDRSPFIHPIIKGIIIHFMIAYVHPFVDGNGRTARALFYWFMLKHGYGLMEYLSISRVIAGSKRSYEKAFMYTENDDMDLGYFVAYNLRVLDTSFKQLRAYIEKKQGERLAANKYLRLEGINERQAQIIKLFDDDPNETITVKDIQTKFMISPTTAKSDIAGLVGKGLLREFSFNKVKKGYARSDLFESIISG